LLLPLSKFLQFRDENKEGKSLKIMPTETLGSIVQLMSEQSSDRVFVVDNRDKPIGIVSIADVIKECLSKST
jgi:CBS domain-containing protein